MMSGANTSVVGLLLAALYSPIWNNAIQHSFDVAIAGIAFIGLQYWRLPSWSIVVFGAVSGAILNGFGII